jgi:protein-arginine kinase activator protein McsA
MEKYYEMVCERCGKKIFYEDTGMVSGRYVCRECYSEIKRSIPVAISSILSRLAEVQLRISRSYWVLQAIHPGSSIGEEAKRRLESTIGDTEKQLQEVYIDLWNYFVDSVWERSSMQ